MAVPAFLLDLVCRAARENSGRAACSAGYPDLLVTPAQLDALLGAGAAQRIPTRDDSANIIRWHGAGSWLKFVFDSKAVFNDLGYALDVLDLHAARGDEILVDLNQPLPPGLDRRYDLVLDTGTCEHCFHIGQAAINLATLVNLNGIIIQAMPLNSYNHGFYNVNPTWVFDFYPLNGFRILYFTAVSNVVVNPQLFDVPMHDRFSQIPENSILVTVAQRTELSDIRIPIQQKYAASPKLGNE